MDKARLSDACLRSLRDGLVKASSDLSDLSYFWKEQRSTHRRMGVIRSIVLGKLVHGQVYVVLRFFSEGGHAGLRRCSRLQECCSTAHVAGGPEESSRIQNGLGAHVVGCLTPPPPPPQVSGKRAAVESDQAKVSTSELLLEDYLQRLGIIQAHLQARPTASLMTPDSSLATTAASGALLSPVRGFCRVLS